MATKDYRIGGAVPSDISVYVHRPQDQSFLKRVEQGSWVEIVGCRTMGKTSMALRWRRDLSEQGITVAYADIAGDLGWNPGPRSLRDWLEKLGRQIAYQLDLDQEHVVSTLLKSKDDSPGALFEKLLLAIKEKVNNKILIILDEIDVLRRLEYGEQLISTLRAFKAKQAMNTRLRDICFCFIGLRSISRVASEKGGSASQLADIIHMTDFDDDPEAIAEMAEGLPDDSMDRAAIVKSTLDYTGGQPLLTMIMLSKAAAISHPNKEDVDTIAAEILEDARDESETHVFIQIQNIIEHFQEDFAIDRNPEQASPGAIYNTYLNLLDGSKEARSPEAPGAQVLLLSGLVRRARESKETSIHGRQVKIEKGELEVKGSLFRNHFGKAWIHTRLSALAQSPQRYPFRSSGGRERIFVLNTGGTVGMVRKGGHVVPPENPEEFKQNYRELEEVARIDFKQHFNVDSINVYPSDWSAIAREIYERRNEGYSGFVVAHGTDTMAYTASAVAFALGENLRVPVVFTGAQTTPDVLHGDARVNLNRACRVALQPIPEVVIAFGAKVLRACRAQKSDDKDFEGFESPNYYPLAYITEEIELRKELLRVLPDEEKDIELRDRFADRVLLIQQYPGLPPDFFDNVLRELAAGHQDYCHGIIIQTLGAGNVATREPHSFIPFISEAIRCGVPVIVTSIYPPRPEGHTEYRTAVAPLEAGAIYAGNMTAAAALTKFSWVLAQAEEIAAGNRKSQMRIVRRMMEKNYIGEIEDIPKQDNKEKRENLPQT
jgi:L-asparaginase type I